jgi:hypothetical protein
MTHKNEQPKYRSNLTVRTFSSKGRVSRIKSHITGRTYHVMSGLELSVFCMIEWAAKISDLYMQVELDLAETLWIAEQLDIKHPVDPKTQKPVTATTDFIACIETNSGEDHFAIEVKPREELNPSTRSGKRHLEKLEIRRRYWEVRNVHFIIMTESEISADLVENVKHLHKYMHEDAKPPIQESLLVQVYSELTQSILKSDESLAKVGASCDTEFALKGGSCLAFTWYLIATRKWMVDIRQIIDPSKKLNFLLQPPFEF